MNPTDNGGHEKRNSLIGRGLSRRTFLAAGAAMTVAAAAAGGPGAGTAQAAQMPVPKGLTHTIRDLKHVVIFMQENRSFDHYFGMLAGVRGFSDKQALQLPGGLDVFHQPDAARTDGGYLLPFHMDSSKVNALSGWDLGHGWGDYHQMWNNGAWNQWVPAKGQLCMGYYTDADIPFQYALARAWTVCDHYYCSIMGPTHPNRLYNWTGMIDPNGTGGGPRAYDNNEGDFNLTWSTFADNLQAAGVDWGTYTNQYSYSVNNWLGDWDNNALEYFQQFKAAALSGDPAQLQYAARADVVFDPATGERVYSAPAPPADYQTNMDYVLSDFITDCANNALPTVSWIAAPANWSEHPGVGERGAHYVARVIEALASNPETWASTLLIINYDEADGLFDHVPPPFPEPGTTDEFLPAISGNAAGHIGPGPRVPAILVSPWTRGGRVFSGVLDHTSSQLFVEYWLRETQGITVTNPNITDWRRSLMSNFQHALDFKNPDFSVPSLPDTTPQLAQFTVDQTLPAVAPPATGDQEMPAQPAQGALQPLSSPYRLHVSAQVDATSGQVTAALANNGTSGACLQVLPDDYLPFAATPFTVLPGRPRTYTWDTTATNGQYSFSVYGPDRFVYSFAGTMPQPGQEAVPDVQAALLPGASPEVLLTLRNLGSAHITYTLTPNDYDGSTRTVVVGGGASRTVTWPTSEYGYYDVIVTDDSGTGFRRRYAGRAGAQPPVTTTVRPESVQLWAGETATVTLTNTSTSAGEGPLTVDWAVEPPADSGITVTPASGSAKLRRGAAASAKLTVKAAATATSGSVSFPVTVTARAAGKSLPVPGGYLQVAVEPPVSTTVSPDSPLLVAPGATGVLTVTNTNISSAHATVNWSANLPADSGITLTPASGSAALAPGASASVSLTVAAATTANPGTFAVPIAVTSTAGSITLASPGASAQVSVPYASLAAAFDNVSITDDSDHSPGNFDGYGNSFSATALANAGITPGGQVTSSGVTFTWPDVAAGQPDNVVASGQSIAMSGSGTTLGFLGAAANNAVAGTGMIGYTDGSTQLFNIGFQNWISATPADGSVLVATTSYFNRATPGAARTPSLFAASVPLAAGKTISYVTLPDVSVTTITTSTVAMHIFAIATG